MTITDWIAIAVILLMIGGALGYIIRAKKRGRGCIGCPDSKNCQGGCGNCQHRN